MTSTAVVPRPIDAAFLMLDPENKGGVETEDRERIDQIKQTVDVTSATSVLGFGTRSEQEMAAFADSVLEQVMSKDTGSVHERLSEMKLIAQGLDASKLKEKKGFFARLFFNVKREVQKFADRFQTARGQIDGIAAQLEDHIMEVQRGIIVLDKLFDQNAENFKELALHIVAGHELLDHYRDTVLPEVEAKAAAAGDDPDGMLVAQEVRDLKAAIERLDRKIMNLEKSKTIAFATMPTIRQVQQTGIILVEELKSAIAHAIPAWKNTMVVAIEQLRQRHGIETLQAMTDFTNAQMRAMADQLHDNSIAIQEQSQRGIVDVDVLTETIGKLIETFDKVEKLEGEAREARNQGRAALAKAEQDLRQQQAGLLPDAPAATPVA